MNTTNQPDIICPYCGVVFTKFPCYIEKLFLYGELMGVICDSCGERLNVFRHHTFTTAKLKESP